MTSISQSSLRALGCIRLRARTRPRSFPVPASNRQYAQLAPKIDLQDHEDQESDYLEQDVNYHQVRTERYGREFVSRHLQELDRARRAETHDEKRAGKKSQSRILCIDIDVTCVLLTSGVDPDLALGTTGPTFTVAPRPFEESKGTSALPHGRNSSTTSHSENTEITRVGRPTSSQPVEDRTSTLSEDEPRSDVATLAQDLSRILKSTSALANPSDALVRALAHHREHISVSSVYTYNLLLSYAARISNYHVMRKILRDMQKGNVQWDDDTRKIVMKATLRGLADNAKSLTARQLGPPKGGVGSLPALIRRLESSMSTVPDEHRQIALNAGYWKSEKPPCSASESIDPHLASTSSPADGSAPATRVSTLQNALFPAMARSHLPPLDVQLSPTLFLAFLRYILACNHQPPSLAESYAALIALDRPEREITSKHLVHLTHLYLHPSLYASFRPFWVIREMQRLSKDGSVNFTPTSQTLEKALLSLRLRRNRDRLAVELVEYFKRKWGEQIISIACWRLVGRYGLERKNAKIQEFATAGGNEALARQIKDDAERRKDASTNDSTAIPESATTAVADEFPGVGLDRRKWGRVRQKIVRTQRRLRREAAQVEASPPA